MTTLALIGVGYWGKNYIETIKKIPSVKIKYLCASNKTLSSLSNEYVKVFNYKDIISYKDIDGVIIATPSPTHFEITKFLLNNKINILVEKPFTTNYSDALTLEKIQKDKNVVFMVGHIYLYNPGFLKFAQLVKDIGKFKRIKLEFGKYDKNMMDGLWEWGPHSISMALYLLNGLPKRVSGKSDVFKEPWPTVNMNLEFDGIKVIVKTGWRFSEQKKRITIKGERGTIIFDDSKKNKIIFRDSSIESFPSYEKDLPLTLEIKEFVDCIRSKRVPRTNIRNAINVIKIIDSVQQSLNKNGEIIKIE